MGENLHSVMQEEETYMAGALEQLMSRYPPSSGGHMTRRQRANDIWLLIGRLEF